MGFSLFFNAKAPKTMRTRKFAKGDAPKENPIAKGHEGVAYAAERTAVGTYDISRVNYTKEYGFDCTYKTSHSHMVEEDLSLEETVRFLREKEGQLIDSHFTKHDPRYREHFNKNIIKKKRAPRDHYSKVKIPTLAN